MLRQLPGPSNGSPRAALPCCLGLDTDQGSFLELEGVVWRCLHTRLHARRRCCCCCCSCSCMVEISSMPGVIVGQQPWGVRHITEPIHELMSCSKCNNCMEDRTMVKKGREGHMKNLFTAGHESMDAKEATSNKSRIPAVPEPRLSAPATGIGGSSRLDPPSGSFTAIPPRQGKGMNDGSGLVSISNKQAPMPKLCRAVVSADGRSSTLGNFCPCQC